MQVTKQPVEVYAVSAGLSESNEGEVRVSIGLIAEAKPDSDWAVFIFPDAESLDDLITRLTELRQERYGK
jgi:hypothetical protein